MSHVPHDAHSVELFYSYAHEDEPLREALEAHLSVLRRERVITAWHDRMIEPGSDWDGRIDEHINSAGIILLLVSADFINSSYCFDVEARRALDRHEAGEARVVPVILRPCDWQETPIRRLQALPRGGKPITTWANMDEALCDVARGIRKVVRELVGPADVAAVLGGGGPPAPVLPAKRSWLWAGGALILLAGLAVTNRLPQLVGIPKNSPVVPKDAAPDPPEPRDPSGVTGVPALPDPTTPRAWPLPPPMPDHDQNACARMAAEVLTASVREAASKVAPVTIENKTGQPVTVLRYAHTCKPRRPNDPDVHELTFQDAPFRYRLSAGEKHDYPRMMPGYCFFRIEEDGGPGPAPPIDVFRDWVHLEPGVAYRLLLDRFAKGGREIVATLDKIGD
jgi:hypothetical protein